MTIPKTSKVPASYLQPGDRILVTTASELATGWNQTELRTPWGCDLKPARVRSDPDGGVTTATVKEEVHAVGSKLRIVTDAGVIEWVPRKSPFLRVNSDQAAAPAPADDTTGLPDWVRVGAKVAEYNDRGIGGATVTTATVERLTTTQIVLSTGRRYRRDTLARVGSTDKLLPVNHPAVRDVHARDAVTGLFQRVDELYRDYRNTLYGHGEVRAAAALDEVAALVEQARQRITRMQAAAKGGAR